MFCGRAVARARLAARSPLRRLVEEATEFGEEAVGGGADELTWATGPYCARGAPPPAPRADPRHHTVLLFPGRGALRPGMGRRLRDVPAAMELYQHASDILGWDVWRACTEGGGSLEARAEPCVLVTALGALEAARAERPGAVERARAAAGPGAGELAALVFAGALSLEAALRVLQVRGAAERACAAERPAGTLQLWLAPDARLGPALAAARDHAAAAGRPDPVCAVAAYLHPGCKLVAGDDQALAWLSREGAAYGVVRSARVRGAGALHSPLMARAGEAVRAAARAAGVRAPRLAVVSCWSGRALRGAAEAERAVWRGVAAPLRWEQALHALYARPAGDHFPLTLALGPAHALRHSLRQVNARAFDASLAVHV